MKKKDLIKRLSEADQIIRRKNEEIEHLKKIIIGERVCDDYCANCIHHISISREPFSCSVHFYCDLDCKCPDFLRK